MKLCSALAVTTVLGIIPAISSVPEAGASPMAPILLRQVFDYNTYSYPYYALCITETVTTSHYTDYWSNGETSAVSYVTNTTYTNIC